MLTGRGKAGGGEFGRKATQVGEAGGEADEVDEVFGGGMELNHVPRLETGVAGNVRKVRSGFASVHDGDFDVARFGRRIRLVTVENVANEVGRLLVSEETRVEINEHAGIAGMEIAQTANILQRAGSSCDGVVHIERDLVAEDHV